MSKNRNRSKLNKSFTSKEYKSFYCRDPYWDEGIRFYPQHNMGFKAFGNRQKQIFSYQRRMYRTWKYNRKKQWKKNL